MNPLFVIAQIVWLKLLRRKDAYVLVVLLGACLTALTTLNVFGLGAMTGYVVDIGLLTAWAFAWILAVTVTARELPGEEAAGTIFPLLAKPVTRLQVVIGKWLGCWSVACAANLAFYLLVAAVAFGRGGTLDLRVFAQAFLLHCTALGIVCAVALLFATRLHADAAAALAFVVTGGSFLFLRHVPEMLGYASPWQARFLFVFYNALPHFEVFDLRRRVVHGFGPVDLSTLAFVLVYGAAVSAALICLAWAAYRGKRFSRGSLPV